MNPVPVVAVRITVLFLVTTGFTRTLAYEDYGQETRINEYDCPDPHPIKQGVFQLEWDKSSVEFTCRPGYSLVGSAIASCDDGRWSSESPICVGTECPTVSIRHSSLVVSHGGGLVKVKCRRGFHLVGSSTLACIDGQWNSTELPRCIAAGATPDTPAANAAAATEDESKLSHEQWLDRSDYSCIQSENTVSPPSVRNARYFMQWAMHGGSPRLYATYQCNWGFVSGSGKRIVYCRQGQWVGSKPNCLLFKVADDHLLQSDTHGSASPRSHDDLLRQADYTCIGSTLEKTVDPPVPEHALATLKFAIADGKPHLYASYACEEGFHLEDPKRNHMYCRERAWFGLLPACVDGSDEIEVDLCVTNNGRCQQLCSSQYGVVSCSCKQGFTLTDDQHTCLDIDECAENNANCQQTCDNIDGGFTCGCYDGYQLNVDGTSCSRSSSEDQT